MALPTNISYGTVVGQFLASLQDGADADKLPEGVPMTGTVTFIASPGYLLDYSASPNPVTILKTPIVCPLDSEGYVCSPYVSGNSPLSRGVVLIATDDPDILPTGWTWTVMYNLTDPNGKRVSLPTQNIYVPAGSETDLTTAMNVAVANGVIITKGDKGDQGIPGSGDDAFIAEQIADPISSTATVLSTTILGKIKSEKPYISVDDMVQPGDTTIAVAWQRAVDLAKTTGIKRIVAESNSYVFGAAGVNFGGLHGCTIEGLGKDSTIITGTVNLFTLFYNTSACSKLTFKGLGFVGPGVDDATGPRRARTTTGPSFRTAIKIQGDLHPTSGVTYEARDIAIENCKFVGLVEGLPIYFSGTRGYSKLTNCVIENCLDPGWIFYENGIATNNVSRRSMDNGFSLSRGGQSAVVTGNEIEDCCYNAIWVAGYDTAAGPENITVTGNVGKRIGHNGVTLQKGGRNATISGNTFYDIRRGPSDEPSDEDGCGVYVSGHTDSTTFTVLTWAENINITGNTIVNPARGGVLVRAGVRSCLIQGNVIVNPGTEFLADGVTAVGTSTVNHNFGTNVLIGTGYPQSTTNNIRSINNQMIDLRTTTRMIYAANNASNSTFYSQSGNWAVGNSQVLTETARTIAGSVQTFTGGLSSGSNSASVGDGYYMQVNGPTTFNREYRISTAGSLRWTLAAGNSGETGSNAGSNFSLRAYSDAGVYLYDAFTVNRATGTPKPRVTTTATRPSAVTAGAGAYMHDSTLNIPLWSDGVTWQESPIVLSPNGTRFRIGVTDSGSLTVTSL